MELIIRNNSGQPIYDQISGQIKAQILSGALSPGDALPSIRGLAKDLKISVITTKRAYDELEAQGLINTVAGKGCFVAEPDLALFREQSLHLLEDHLAAAAELAAENAANAAGAAAAETAAVPVTAAPAAAAATAVSVAETASAPEKD